MHTNSHDRRGASGQLLLLGAFGQGNPGDEALASSFVRRLRGRDIVVATGDPAGIEATLDCAAIPSAPSAVARMIPSSRAVVVGGGTIFKELHRSTGRHRLSLLARTAAVLALARARGVRTALVGVGADTLVGGPARRLGRRIVAAADLVVLRDEESAAALIAAGVPGPLRVGADPAWTALRTRDHTASPADGPAIVVPSHLADEPDSRGLPNRLARAVEPLGQLGIDVQVQPWQGGDDGLDHELARAVAEQVPGAELIPPPTDLDDAARRFESARVVVGLRFHALVAAAAAGRPFVSVVHEPKLAGLARRLEQHSVPAHAPPAVLTLAIERTLRGQGPDRAAVALEARRAEDQFRLLELLLDAGAGSDAEIGRDLVLTSGGGSW